MVSVLKALETALTGSKALNSVPSSRGWWPVIRESFTGAWQRNISVNQEEALAFHAVYACTTLIAGDIAKLRMKLVQMSDGGVWTETTNPAYSPVLRKPNRYQTRNQFIESWVLSRLLRGNAYILKRRDARLVVNELYVLDPQRVRPLVADDGSVYYELDTDNMSGVTEAVIVPAREIIHDRWNTLFHPLVGVPPIYACGLAATHGLSIQNSQTKFFQNNSQPGGILTAPGRIDQETAVRLKESWDTNFGGDNAGKVSVLGDGLTYEKLSMTAEESQLIEQLRWSAETVCSTYHIPPHMIGAGPVPALGNVESLQMAYYSQAIQGAIEAMETCLDEGLGTGDKLGVEFDLSGLLRMDTATQIKALAEAVGGTIMAPNEARRELGLPPKRGGDELYAQQQDFSLAALAERDRNKPFAAPAPAPEAKSQPIVFNVNKEGEAISARTVKTIRTHRDEFGNLGATVIEEPATDEGQA